MSINKLIMMNKNIVQTASSPIIKTDQVATSTQTESVLPEGSIPEQTDLFSYVYRS